MKCSKLAVLFFFCNLSVAKDLGAMGEVFPIAEQSMVDYIYGNLNKMQENGDLERIKSESIKRIQEHAVRPSPVHGYTKVEHYNKFLINPSYQAPHDVFDAQGNLIIKAGTLVNPLFDLAQKQIPYTKILVFIDGDSKKQIQWLKTQLNEKYKVILINGNVKETSDALHCQVYFDQVGMISRKFNLTKVPTVIKPAGYNLSVEEIDIGERNE